MTADLLREAEATLAKLEQARDGNMAIRSELRDLVNGRTGRLKEVINHLNELIGFKAGKETQRSRYLRLKRAHEQVWDTRPQSSIAKDPSSYYRIPLKPALFDFPSELNYYPPAKYPMQMKNQRGKFKNFGGVFLTEVTTSEGSRFPRIRGGTQPEWISMMLKARVSRSVKRVYQWKALEEMKQMMQLEEQLMKRLGVDDVGYVEPIDQALKEVRESHKKLKFDTNSRNVLDGSLDDMPT
ncbi:hypothetical protein BGZ54_001037 [Gamsiella multidivaricata]|nr:hypothetical protein BGZ54_001037 [Gamsiella multidivaricata]